MILKCLKRKKNLCNKVYILNIKNETEMILDIKQIILPTRSQINKHFHVLKENQIFFNLFLNQH